MAAGKTRCFSGYIQIEAVRTAGTGCRAEVAIIVAISTRALAAHLDIIVRTESSVSFERGLVTTYPSPSGMSCRGNDAQIVRPVLSDTIAVRFTVVPRHSAPLS